VGPRNHVLNGYPDLSTKGGDFGVVRSIQKHYKAYYFLDLSKRVSPAKMLSWLRHSFEDWLGYRLKEPRLRWGSNPALEQANFGGCLTQWKALGASAAVYAAKGIIQSLITVCSRRDHSILNSGTTRDVAFW